MRERAIRFGQNSMIGVLTEPAPEERIPDAPVVLFLNSGLLHRVGACRFHVRAARALAPRGFTSLRFDFSGVGDSEPRKDALAFEEASVSDVREAMAYLEKNRNARSFVLIGLCSGADMAYETARVDPRVEAIGQLDAYVYRTWRFYLHRYAPRLVKSQTWINVLTGKTVFGPFIRKLLKTRGQGDGEQEADQNLEISPYAREFPPKEVVAAGLKTLVNRGVRFFNFFSGDACKYRAQYLDCFRDVGFGNQLRLEFISASDHLVTKLPDQEYLVGAMTDWVAGLHSEPVVTPAAQPVPSQGSRSSGRNRSRVDVS